MSAKISSRWLARLLSFSLVAALLLSGIYPFPAAQAAPLDRPVAQASPLDRAAQIAAEDPDFVDDFSADEGTWETSYDSDTAVYFKAGALHISIDADNVFAWSSSDLSAADFLAGVEVSHAAGPLVNEGGLIFRYVDSDNFYVFNVSSDGYFVVKKLEEGAWISLVEWTESDLIETGEESANFLAVLAEGPQLSFFINEELAAEVEDDSFTEGGIALAAGSIDDTGVDIAFDEFVFWPVSAANGPQPTLGIPGRRVPSTPTPQPQDEPLSIEERVADLHGQTPAFSDDFSAGSGEWDSESSDDSIFDFVDGVFYLNVLPVDWVTYSQTDYVYTDFLAEVDTTHSFGPTAVEYGLYFRNVDGGNYYYYAISAGGHFNFWKRIDGEWQEILPWTESDALEVGEGAYNRLGVLAEGHSIALLANDVVLAEVEDDSMAAGSLGVFVRTYDEEDVEIAFDNVDVWNLTPSAQTELIPPADEDTIIVDAAAVEARIGDIRAGEPAVSETFGADTGAWDLTSSDEARLAIERRRLHIGVDSPNWITWSLYTTPLSDFLLEVDAEAITSLLDGSYGVVFRTLDADNFYLFRISPRGTFSFTKKAGGEWTTVIDWTASDAIDTAEGAANRLSVLAEGDELAFLVNDVVVAQAVDADLSDGQVGLAAGVYDESGLEVAFDNVDIWDLAQ